MRLIEDREAVNNFNIDFSHLHLPAKGAQVGIACRRGFDHRYVLRVANLMNPFQALGIPALNPFHCAIPFLLFHAYMAVIVRFYLVAAFATVKLIVHYQILAVF